MDYQTGKRYDTQPTNGLTVNRHEITTHRGAYIHAMVHSAGIALLFWSTAYGRWWPCESARVKFGSCAQHLADEFNRDWALPRGPEVSR